MYEEGRDGGVHLAAFKRGTGNHSQVRSCFKAELALPSRIAVADACSRPGLLPLGYTAITTPVSKRPKRLFSQLSLTPECWSSLHLEVRPRAHSVGPSLSPTDVLFPFPGHEAADDLAQPLCGHAAQSLPGHVCPPLLLLRKVRALASLSTQMCWHQLLAGKYTPWGSDF